MSGLVFDWEAVSETPVLAVVGRNERRRSDGSLAWDALAFAFGEDAVVLTVTKDTDEIVVAHEAAPQGEHWNTVTVLGDAVGKPLGWSWVGTNYRGYRDSFTLAVGNVIPDALQPRLTFLAEACTITCFDLRPRAA